MFLNEMNIPIYANKKVHFREVSKALAHRVFKYSMGLDMDEASSALRKKLDSGWTKKYKELHHIEPSDELSQQSRAGRLIFTFLNKHRARQVDEDR